MTHEHAQISCSLSPDDAAGQAERLTDLRRQAIAAESLEAGAALTFGTELADQVEEFARREAECCGSFLSIETIRTDDGVRLEVTSENPAAHPMIDAMCGTSRS